MHFNKLLAIFLLLGYQIVFSQNQQSAITKVAPSHWYIGMKNQKLQLMLYGKNIGDMKASVEYDGVKLVAQKSVENSNYLFLDLHIGAAKAGTMPVILQKSITIPARSKRKKPTTAIMKLELNYELKDRTAKPNHINSSDLVYLILPDRFANADPTNDKFNDMADTVANRQNPFLRHGGDLKGIQNKLDYLKDLGVTALWLNPVIENDQPQTNEGGEMRAAYHGYGFTDHYNVDRRLGGNKAYKDLIEAAHSKGIKIIQDAVYNHVGINHWFLRDLPMKSWLNQWEKYTNTTYRDEPVYDPYASEIDKEEMLHGWFVPFLPDLNHSNEFVKNYLIQHALWTVENFNIDGWRVDTYQYNDPEFMLACNAALYEEYPGLFITGENAVNHTIPQVYYSENNLNLSYKGTQSSANDFVLESAILSALNEKFDWGKGFNKIYTTLAQDLVYKNPMNNLIFLDNHDQDRFFSIVKEDLNKYKMGITLLMTLRGIPQLYYGTEILTKNFKNPSDAEARKDFPGGWLGDPINKFSKDGRTEKENEAFNFVKKIANYRKNTPALHSGKFLQYLPKDGVYVFFRKNEAKTIMIVLNQNETAKSIDLQRYTEGIGGKTQAKNIVNEQSFALNTSFEMPAMGSMVLELY